MNNTIGITWYDIDYSRVNVTPKNIKLNNSFVLENFYTGRREKFIVEKFITENKVELRAAKTRYGTILERFDDWWRLTGIWMWKDK